MPTGCIDTGDALSRVPVARWRTRPPRRRFNWRVVAVYCFMRVGKPKVKAGRKRLQAAFGIYFTRSREEREGESLHINPHLITIRPNLRYVHRLPHQREGVEGARDFGAEGVADLPDSLRQS